MSRRIMVIDDEEAIRDSFQLALEETDYHVEAAESGEKGIEKMRKGKYDLVFLDLKMPGMNGVETLRELRKLDGDVRIHIVTAFHSDFGDQLKQAAEDGIDFEMLKKPLTSDEIHFVARSVLEGLVDRK